MSSLRNYYDKITQTQSRALSLQESLVATGRAFSAINEETALALNNNNSIVIETLDTTLLLIGVFVLFNNEKVAITVHEDVTSVAGDSALATPIFNPNRESTVGSINANITAGNLASISGGSVIHGPISIYGTAGQGSNSGPGNVLDPDQYMIFKKNSRYVIEATNLANASTSISLVLQLAEKVDSI